MKDKIFTSIGLMSGTSMDGVDVSVIKSDGIDYFINILDKYYEYDNSLRQKIVNLRNLVLLAEDLDKYIDDIKDVEREITLFHSKIVDDITSIYTQEVDLIGFHGQTIFHSPEQKITRQLGDGELLSQLVRKKVVYNFRQEDLINKGQGAPLTPIFHNLISKKINKKFGIKFPICFITVSYTHLTLPTN